MLDVQAFKVILENSPLISIEIRLICGGQIFFGDHKNEPLKGECDSSRVGEYTKMKAGKTHC